jgi:hypothetical protein
MGRRWSALSGVLAGVLAVPAGAVTSVLQARVSTEPVPPPSPQNRRLPRAGRGAVAGVGTSTVSNNPQSTWAAPVWRGGRGRELPGPGAAEPCLATVQATHLPLARGR